MKKIAALLFILPLLFVTTAKAEPNWGPLEPWVSYKDTPSGLHIVKDPLVVASLLPTPAPGLPPATPTAVPMISGWVIFVCSDEIAPYNAPDGFEYSVTAKGLSPEVHYDVRAYPQLGSADFGAVSYRELGTLVSNGKGEGKISGFIDLSAGGYLYIITVELSGSIVLTSLPPFTYWDPNLDPPYVPFPLGSYLWFSGDTQDFVVVK